MSLKVGRAIFIPEADVSTASVADACGMPRRQARDNAADVRSPPSKPMPRRGRDLGRARAARDLPSFALGYAGRRDLDPEGRQRRRPRRRHLRSAGNLRRRSPGRRPARLLQRPGDDPGLQRPAVLQLPRGLPQHDPDPGRRLRPAGRREAALPPLLEQRKPAASSASTGPRRPPSRATAGSTPTSSSATRTKPNISASTRTSSTRSPAESRN